MLYMACCSIMLKLSSSWTTDNQVDKQKVANFPPAAHTIYSEGGSNICSKNMDHTFSI